jgi:hypothetical protein
MYEYPFRTMMLFDTCRVKPFVNQLIGMCPFYFEASSPSDSPSKSAGAPAQSKTLARRWEPSVR